MYRSADARSPANQAKRAASVAASAAPSASAECAKSVECFGRQLDAVAAKAEQGACVLQQEPRPCRVIRSCEGERVREESGGRAKGGQRQRPLTRRAHCDAGASDELGLGGTRGSHVLERACVVTGEQLGVVGDATERLDPLGCSAMLLGADCAGDLAVGDVAEEHVAEGVLHLAGNRGAAHPLHELLPIEPAQDLLGLQAVVSADRFERSDPEDLARDGGVLEELLSESGNASRRAAMMPWIVSGRSTSSPRSISARAYCSAYSGLPPILASSGWS